MRIITVACLLAAPSFAQDCNFNGIPDVHDIACGRSPDWNSNGVPDECESAQLWLYQDFDGNALLPTGVTESFTGTAHVTTACRPPFGGASGDYVYFGIDATCNFDTGQSLDGTYTIDGPFDLPNDSYIMIGFWSYFEGEELEYDCHSFDYYDYAIFAAHTSYGFVELDEYCDDFDFVPPAPPQWQYKTAFLPVNANWWHYGLFGYFETYDGFSNQFFGYGLDEIRIWVFSATDVGALPQAVDCFTNTFCTSNPNSTGVAATVWGNGSRHASSEYLKLNAVDLPPGEFGYFLMSLTQDALALPAPSQGILCMGSPFIRIRNSVLNSGSLGRFELQLDFQNLPQGTMIQADESWNFQAWFRDGAGSNTTDAINLPFH